MQGINGINGMDSHQVIQMQPMPHTQLPQPSFFGGESVFHAMLDGVEEDDPAVIYGQQHPMYGIVGMQPDMRGAMQGAPSIVTNMQALQVGQ